MNRIFTMATLALATSTSFAMAGGPAAVAAEPLIVAPVATPTSGLGAGAVVGGLLLLALVAGSGSDSNTTTTTTTTN